MTKHVRTKNIEAKAMRIMPTFRATELDALLKGVIHANDKVEIYENDTSVASMYLRIDGISMNVKQGDFIIVMNEDVMVLDEYRFNLLFKQNKSEVER